MQAPRAADAPTLTLVFPCLGTKIASSYSGCHREGGTVPAQAHERDSSTEHQSMTQATHRNGLLQAHDEQRRPTQA